MWAAPVCPQNGHSAVLNLHSGHTAATFSLVFFGAGALALVGFGAFAVGTESPFSSLSTFAVFLAAAFRGAFLAGGFARRSLISGRRLVALGATEAARAPSICPAVLRLFFGFCEAPIAKTDP